MTQKTWTAVDNYVSEMLVPSDKALDAALEASADSGLPEIAVAPNQGKFLMLLARSINARNILEIGTLGGYSTIWLARALPKGGRVVTLEAVPRHAEVARSNFERAGLASMIDLRLGKAIDTLPKLAAEKPAPFDFIFIDADKENYEGYYERGLTLLRPGGVMAIDNVLWNGAVADPKVHDPMTDAIRALNDKVAKDRRVAISLVPIGDGLTLARKLS
jgi:predicted O-methyltransferase YrrM